MPSLALRAKKIILRQSGAGLLFGGCATWNVALFGAALRRLVESGTRYLLLKMLALRAENVSARIDKLKIDGYSKVVAESRI